MGKKFDPHYRVVAIQTRTKREGRTLEDLGHYSPIKKVIELKKDRIQYWLGVGAQPTDTVKGLLVKQQILTAPKEKANFKHEPGKKKKERAAK